MKASISEVIIVLVICSFLVLGIKECTKENRYREGFSKGYEQQYEPHTKTVIWVKIK